ncbi:MAG: hypothetical protein IKP84_05650, partial [Prevotella sp.]|nr:hypothetical protein [Prevotella sp.]
MIDKNSKINAKGEGKSLPLGIRQKNHLNIRRSDKNHWQGEQFRNVNDKFCTFEDELFGYRAALKIIAVTYRKRGILQLSGVISTWAPRSENNTSMYFAYVLARLIERMGIQKVDDFFMPEPCIAFKDFYVSLICLALKNVESKQRFKMEKNEDLDLLELQELARGHKNAKPHAT